MQNIPAPDRYIVFLIDSKIKDHDGKIFCSHKEAKEFANEVLNENYADKAVIGMFCLNTQAQQMQITMVETIGFKGDKKATSQMALFAPITTTR